MDNSLIDNVEFDCTDNTSEWGNIKLVEYDAVQKTHVHTDHTMPNKVNDKTWKCSECNHTNNLIETLDFKCSNCLKSTFSIQRLSHTHIEVGLNDSNDSNDTEMEMILSNVLSRDHDEQPEEEEEKILSFHGQKRTNINIDPINLEEHKFLPFMNYKPLSLCLELEDSKYTADNDVILNIMPSDINIYEKKRSSHKKRESIFDVVLSKAHKWNEKKTALVKRDSYRITGSHVKRQSIIDVVLKKAHKWNEEKELIHYLHDKDIKEITLISSFVEPRDDDAMCNGDIAKCNAIKRVIHLLEYYKKYQTMLIATDTSVIPIYEYISSLKNYGVSMFMEDWYQCKKKHFRAEKDVDFFKNIEWIVCDNIGSCIYLERYERNRERNLYRINQEIDHKNLILMDQLNSIHTFIFHWVASRLRNVEMVKNNDALIETDENMQPLTILENNSPHDSTKKVNIWSNNPASVQQCNVEQIIYILNHYVLEKDELKKLREYKDDIIKYIKENKFDGHKIFQTKRKVFITQITEYFGDKKAKGSFTKLHKRLVEYDVLLM